MKILNTIRNVTRSKSMRRLFFPNFYHNYVARCGMSNYAYQFRVNRPTYYPDRRQEMERATEQMKSQLVPELPETKKNLPKDYYYRILGVTRKASAQQIKQAYYSLAKLYHPDISHTRQVTKRFQEISNAYHILSDESKRLEYDQLGTLNEFPQATRTTAAPKTGATAPAINKGIKNPPKAPPFVADKTTREELIHMTTGEPRLELTFLEAALGTKKSMELRFMKKCPACNGKAPRLVGRIKPEICRKCNGTGQINKRTATFSSVIVCDQCDGKRYTHRNNCNTCENRGVVLEINKIVVPVPSGVKTGEVVAVENPKTGLMVNYRVQVQESKHYRRVGNDVHSDKYLTLSQVILGGIFKVRGIYEEIELKVEPGMESHQQIVIKGHGIRTREGTGDHVITVKLRLPQKLSMKQRQLIMAFAKTEDHTFEHTL